MTSNRPETPELSPFAGEAWRGRADTRVLLVALNVDGYYSVPVRLLSLLCRDSGELAGRFDVRFVEATVDVPLAAFADQVRDWNPDIVGFSVNIWNRNPVFRLARELRRRMETVCLLAGGQEVSGSCIDTLARVPELDFLIDGEGEIPFQEFLRGWDGVGKRLKDPEAVSGLWYRRDGASLRTRPAQWVRDLDRLPSPALAGLVPVSEKQKLGVLLEGSRSCPFRCAFCFEGSKEAPVRSVSVSRLIEEIDFMVERGATYFHIMDPILCLGGAGRMRELSDHVAKLSGNGHALTFSVETYAEHIDDDAAACLKPFSIIDVGLQSVNEATLKAIRRQYVPERFQAGLQRLRDVSAPFNLYLICGLPHETLASYLAGVRFVLENRPSRLFLNELCLLNGTALRRQAAELGYVYDDDPPYQVRETAWMSAFELAIAQRVSKAVEKQYNLSAEGIFIRYPWLPDRPVGRGRRFDLPVAGACSFGCVGCPDGSGPGSWPDRDGDWERFCGADVHLLAGDGSDPEEILRVAGRLRLFGAARIGLAAPPRLFGDAAFVSRLMENGVWHCRTFVGPSRLPGADAPGFDEAAIEGALASLDRSFPLAGRAVIRPHVEVVVWSGRSSRPELDRCLERLVSRCVSVVTVADRSPEGDTRTDPGEMAGLFMKHSGARSWIRIPESAMEVALRAVRHPRDVMDHLKGLGMIGPPASKRPPCFRGAQSDKGHQAWPISC